MNEKIDIYEKKEKTKNRYNLSKFFLFIILIFIIIAV